MENECCLKPDYIVIEIQQRDNSNQKTIYCNNCFTQIQINQRWKTHRTKPKILYKMENSKSIIKTYGELPQKYKNIVDDILQQSKKLCDTEKEEDATKDVTQKEEKEENVQATTQLEEVYDFSNHPKNHKQ